MINPKGVREWVTGRKFNAGEIILKDNYLIRCVTAHTAGTFATDIQSDKWTMATPMKNNLINSNFDHWQRGFGPLLVNSANKYLADRWGAHQFQQGYVSRQTLVVSGSHPGSSSVVLRCSGNGSTAMRVSIGQPIELANAVQLRGKTVTLSGLIRFSSATMPTSTLGDFRINIGYSNTSNDGSFNTSDYLANGSNATVFTQGTLSTTWTKFAISLTIGSSAQNIAAVFQFLNEVVATTGDWFEISQVILSEGPAPSAFQMAGSTISDELLLCQKYVEKSYSQGIAPGTASYAVGYVAARWAYVDGTNESLSSYVSFKATKRVAPTITRYSPRTGASGQMDIDGTNDNATSPIVALSDGGFSLSLNGNYATQGQQATMHWVADAEL